VALTFSILAALLGLAVISWYGLAGMGEFEKATEEHCKGATQAASK
jgi:hypothetical protein